MPVRTVAVALHDSAPGGAGIAFLRAAPHVAEHGWRPVFWFPGAGPGPDMARGLGMPVRERERPIRYSLRGLRDAPGPARRLAATPGYLRDFAGWLRELRPDVLHANSLYTLPEASCARRLGIPVVVHVHELQGDRPKDRAILRWAAGAADRLVAVSEAAAAPLRRYGGPPVDVVPNGIPAFGPGLRPAEEPIVGTVGVVSPRKGTDVFLAMAELVARARPDARFVVLGPDGEGRDAAFAAEVHRRVRALGGRVRVEVRSSRDVVGEMRGWSVFALPARQDPYPLAVLEAMAVGLPVVASRVGGIPEQLEDGRSGLLVDPDDVAATTAAVLALLADDDLRRRVGGRAAVRAAERFGLGTQGAALAAVYDAATGDDRPRSLERAA